MLFRNDFLTGGLNLKFSPDDGAGGAGGGAGGSVNLEDPAIKAAIETEIEKRTSGLKKNQAQILDEKKKLKDDLDKLRGEIDSVGGEEGFKRVRGFLEELEKTEEGKLLAAGKHEEWHTKRTETLRSNHKTELEARQKAAEAAEARAVLAESRYNNLVLKNEVMTACKDAGVEASAYDDVHLRANNTFSFDPAAKRYVIKDEEGTIVTGADGTSPKSIREWVEDQKKTSRHWFPVSQGSGASGSGAQGKGSTYHNTTDFSEYAANREKDASFKDARSR